MHQMHRNQLAAAPEQLLQQDLVFTAHVIFIILFFASNSPCVFLKSPQLLGFGQTGVKSEHLLAILVGNCGLDNDERVWNWVAWFDLLSVTLERDNIELLLMVPPKPVKFYRIPVGTW